VAKRTDESAMSVFASVSASTLTNFAVGPAAVKEPQIDNGQAHLV